jgi:hypothetical protein
MEELFMLTCRFGYRGLLTICLLVFWGTVGRPETLRSSSGSDEKEEYIGESKREVSADKTETVVTDKVINRLVLGRTTFSWNAAGRDFRGELPSGVREGKGVTAGIIIQKWNTYQKLVASGVGELVVAGTANGEGEASMTANRWIPVPKAAKVPAKLSYVLYATLQLDEKGKTIVECRSVVTEPQPGRFTYRYRIKNTSGQHIRVEWAGFSENLVDGKTLDRTVESKGLGTEETGAAVITLDDKTKYKITSHFWSAPK